MVKSPQEGPETCHFLLELGAWDWLGEVQPGSLVGEDERWVVQEALKDICNRSTRGQGVKFLRKTMDCGSWLCFHEGLSVRIPPLSSAPGGGAQEDGGALAGPSL